MLSSPSVMSTGIPVVGCAERWITGDIWKCGKTVSELNRYSSKYNARMHGFSRARNVCRASPGYRWSQHFFVLRAVDQSNILSERHCSSKDVDEDNAAESAAEIAEDWLQGVADDRGKQSQEVCIETPSESKDEGQLPQNYGSVLGAVADSANHAADAMKSTLQKAGEFVNGTGEDTQASGNTRDTKHREAHGLDGSMNNQLDQEGDREDESHEAERDIMREDNDAGKDIAEREREHVTGLTNQGQQESNDTTTEVDGSGHDFRDQARRIQEDVQEQAQDFVDSIKSGASKASEQVQAAGWDIINRADHAFGFSREEEEVFSKILKLRPEDFEEAYIEIDDGSAQQSIHL